MPLKTSNCPHVNCIDSVTWEELRLKQSSPQECQVCGIKSANLWLCLVGPCQFVGCGETHKDHSADHAQEKNHCMTINLTTLRIWCTRCEIEVFPNRNTPQLIIPENSASVQMAKQSASPSSCSSMSHRVDSYSADSSPRRSLSGGEDSDSDMEEENTKPRGLTGLQNLGNTCYLNAALQSLSNCPPLTRYFLDCHGFIRPEKTPKLAVSYMKLVSELWHKKRRSYVVPSSVVNGIKIVHPMFRGYSQQDSQEFLRCFMDEIHEELKQPITHDDDSENESSNDSEENNQPTDTTYVKHHGRQLSMDLDSNSSSQSEDFYETCDSGLSSDKASTELSDDSCEVNERMRLNNSDQNNKSVDNRNNLRNRQIPETDSGVSSISRDDSVITSKSKKESANKLSRNKANVESCPDFNDALSDSEVMSSRRNKHSSLRQRSKSENVDVLQAQKIFQSQTKRYTDKTARKKTVHYRSIISDIFDGKILSSVQCLTCERVSTTRETFQDLSLPIPSKDHLHMIHSSPQLGMPPKGGTCGEAHQGWISWMFTWMKSFFVGPMINLQDCLSAFFSADELKGDNMYSCEKCKKLRNGVKYSRVMELPEILCIHLKRFRHEFYSSKISTYVTFPLDSLDMKPYIHKDCKSEVLMYDLVAVICHHGTAGGGHYTAYCLNTINETWYEFDDQYVTEVDVSQVINCEAYVLFYRKRDDEAIPVRQKAQQLMEAREPSLLQFYVSKEWINRFNTFSEPGPITNSDFLCSHGGVPPDKVNHVGDLVLKFNRTLWDFLHGRFGGGPVCNHLYPCITCQNELEQLQNRQKSEIEQFIQLHDKFRDEDNPPVIYYISMNWFKEWENFVRGKTNAVPGPIDNSRISTTKSGQLVVKHNSDHGQLSKETWQFLFSIYGGGPELAQIQSLSSSCGASQTLQDTCKGSTSASSSTTSQDKTVSASTQEKTTSAPSSTSENSSTVSNSSSLQNQCSALSSGSDLDSTATTNSGSRSQEVIQTENEMGARNNISEVSSGTKS